MKPLVYFPDAQAATLAVLRAHVSAHTDESVTYGTKPLDVKKDGRPELPYVAVRIDATSTGVMRTDQTATLRVAIWHKSEASGLALAQIVLGVLAAYAGDDAVRAFQERTGPIPTEDPDTGAPLSYFTVAARLRPVPME